jgi:hypothetical protein
LFVELVERSTSSSSSFIVMIIIIIIIIIILIITEWVCVIRMTRQSTEHQTDSDASAEVTGSLGLEHIVVVPRLDLHTLCRWVLLMIDRAEPQTCFRSLFLPLLVCAEWCWLWLVGMDEGHDAPSPRCVCMSYG